MQFTMIWKSLYDVNQESDFSIGYFFFLPLCFTFSLSLSLVNLHNILWHWPSAAFVSLIKVLQDNCTEAKGYTNHFDPIWLYPHAIASLPLFPISSTQHISYSHSPFPIPSVPDLPVTVMSMWATSGRLLSSSLLSRISPLVLLSSNRWSSLPSSIL